MADTFNPSPEELEAIQLRWRAQHPEALDGQGPTVEESAVLLLEIRERMAAIENETLRMLSQATRNTPSRTGANSKYLQLFWISITIAGVSAYFIYRLFSR